MIYHWEHRSKNPILKNPILKNPILKKFVAMYRLLIHCRLQQSLCHRLSLSLCHRLSLSPCRVLVLLLLATTCLIGATSAADDSLSQLTPFLKQHCYECHGVKKQENDKRFDSLDTDLSNIETVASWQGILDQLNLGEMPPEDKPQPSVAETAKVIELLNGKLREAYAKLRSTGGQTVARRLNRFELRNTVRDLLYIKDPELRIGNVARLVDNNGNGRVENTSTDPFRLFPADEEEDGFD
ncbi:MAG: hypothetical protein ACI9HK_002720, partial [Pirellulaceae bacterium]